MLGELARRFFKLRFTTTAPTPATSTSLPLCVNCAADCPAGASCPIANDCGNYREQQHQQPFSSSSVEGQVFVTPPARAETAPCRCNCDGKLSRHVYRLLVVLSLCVLALDLMLLLYVHRVAAGTAHDTVTNSAVVAAATVDAMPANWRSEVQQLVREEMRLAKWDSWEVARAQDRRPDISGRGDDGRHLTRAVATDSGGGNDEFQSPTSATTSQPVAAAAAGFNDPEAGDYFAATQRSQRVKSHLNNIQRGRREASLALDNLLRVSPPNVDDVDKTYVEFFNPKHRRELEKKDEEYKKLHGTKGAAPGGDDWVWMTNYCRIPYESITGFCSSTKDYCPAGAPGAAGQAGQKGYRGDIGMPGAPGREGVPGARGPKGMPGAPGLDGRDGVPGEPGLDGVPGRSGADGIPGKDGKHGAAGKDGQNGQNGRDGKEGATGAQGPPGIPGERGLTGPKGRVGRPGNNGKNGDNGVCVYGKMLNGTLAKELLIPPSIALNATTDPARPIIVYEGRHLRLRCPATGFPKPHVEWRRVDQQTTRVGAYDETSLSGHTLNITKINRVHMADYQCVADNGIPPSASVIFKLEVHFAPLIRVRYQHVYASEGSSVTLECEIEAFPEPVKFWKRRLDNRVLEPSDKFRMETTLDGLYKSKMQLNITRIRGDDYGEYHCVSKNEVNTTTGILYVNDRTKPPNRGYADVPVIFGPEPPESESYEDICGPPTTCPECTELAGKDGGGNKCRDSLPLYDLVGHLEIKPADPYFQYPGLPNRTFDCVLYAVGKPVFTKYTNETYGAWLRDPAPRNEAVAEKYWATGEADNRLLFEFTDREMFRTNVTRVHHLEPPGFVGNAHVVYNGSFYYHQKSTSRVVRYDLETSRIAQSNIIPKAAFDPSPNYLYTSKHTYMDFNIEDNGLWVIYSVAHSNNTHVAKLDTYTLKVQYAWNISINHHKVGDMFIVCGVLYAVDSVTERLTKIRLALDLYRNILLEDVNLSFTNPFKLTTTVGYNHRNKELYTWDRGNQLAYPTRYHEMGVNSSSHERSDDMPYGDLL